MIRSRGRCLSSAEAPSACHSNFGAGLSYKLIVLTSVSILSFGAPVFAQTATISTETSVPVATSTADGGDPADIDITENGSITIDQVDGTAAVTVDSDNAVNNDGTIQIDELTTRSAS